MTLPDERARALELCLQIVFDLVERRASVAVLRQRAIAALRHAPTRADLHALAKARPDILDPLIAGKGKGEI